MSSSVAIKNDFITCFEPNFQGSTPAVKHIQPHRKRAENCIIVKYFTRFFICKRGFQSVAVKHNFASPERKRQTVSGIRGPFEKKLSCNRHRVRKKKEMVFSHLPCALPRITDWIAMDVRERHREVPAVRRHVRPDRLRAAADAILPGSNCRRRFYPMF